MAGHRLFTFLLTGSRRAGAGPARAAEAALAGSDAGPGRDAGFGRRPSPVPDAEARREAGRVRTATTGSRGRQSGLRARRVRLVELGGGEGGGRRFALVRA